MRVGILGGTFDPIHIGHLIIAEQAREQASLDEIWFLPSARPPHKMDSLVTPFERRVEMLQLALAGQDRFRIEPIEKERSGPSYTADTLDEIARRDPGLQIGLIIGGDCLPDFPGWYQPLRIIERASLLVAARPGWKLWSQLELAQSLDLEDPTRVRMQVLDVPLIDISSRDLRRRAAEGRSIRYLVPRPVEQYIRDRRVYRLDQPNKTS